MGIELIIVVLCAVIGLGTSGSVGSDDFDSSEVGLFWMDALLVTLEAIDALELLIAIGTPPYCFVRVRQ